jgi:hypothetical protein
MSKAKGTGRFVVAHTLVDGHPEGTILHAHDAKADFGTVDYTDRDGRPGSFPRRMVHGARKLDSEEQQARLLKAGAIREASADELELAGENAERLPSPRSPLAAEGPPFTVEERDAKIQRLETLVADLQAKHKPIEEAIVSGRLVAPKGFKTAGMAEASAGADVARLEGEIATKDAEIERLRTSLAEAQQRAAAVQGQSTGGSPDADYDALTVPELRDLAVKHKLDVPSHASKADTIAALKGAGVRAPKAK